MKTKILALVIVILSIGTLLAGCIFLCDVVERDTMNNVSETKTSSADFSEQSKLPSTFIPNQFTFASDDTEIITPGFQSKYYQELLQEYFYENGIDRNGSVQSD